MSKFYRRKDPLTGFRFRVRFLGENEDIAGFSTVSGLEMKIETETYLEGGSYRVFHLPKGFSYTNAVLKRGISDKKMLNWFEEVLSSVTGNLPVPYKDVVISVFSSEDFENPELQLILEDAIPVKWSLSDFNAQSNSVLFESVELSFRSLRKDGK
ncbi:phage tail protein [Persephonella sp.]